MKILLVNNRFCKYGGAEKIAIQDYEWLKKQGHDVYFFATDSKPYYIENYEYSKYFPRYWRTSKDYIKNPFKYYYNFEAKNKLQQIINNVKPDLIHLHAIEDFTYSILSCCKNIPTIMTIHGNFVCVCPSNLLYKNQTFCKNFYCKNGNYFNCLKNKCAKNQLEPSFRRTLYGYISKSIFKNVDKFITPSNAMRELATKANIGINENNISVINNSLNNAIELTNYSNNGYFLFVGRLGHEKGLPVLLEAMKELPKDILLHVVGTGPMETQLKDFVSANNLKNVEFLGFKSGIELEEEYKNCIATITPSNCFDNFPTTTLESFIYGKPVIGSSIGGIPEQIENNINGLIFEPANVEELKICILKYWNNVSLAVSHGKNGYQKLRKKYTEENYYNNLLKVYSEVLHD